MSGTPRRVLAAIATAMAILALSAASAAAHPQTVQVHGTQTVVDESAGLYRMHGGLLGKWYILTFDPIYVSDAMLIGSGTERMDGCLDRNRNHTCNAGEPNGSLRFDYIYWASFNPSTGALIEGNCVHPITGGTGGFANARGLLTMHDTPVGNEVRTTYKGTVVLHAVSASAARPLAAAAPTGAARTHNIC